MLRTFPKSLVLILAAWLGLLSERYSGGAGVDTRAVQCECRSGDSRSCRVLDRVFCPQPTHNTEWMTRIQESIRQAGFEPLPSAANFFLIRFADADTAAAALEFLRQRGILLRNMVPYGLPDCLRMSLGDAEEMEITTAAFKDLGVHLSGRGNGSTS